MKSSLPLLITLLLTNLLQAQNLVSNPGFESFSALPNGAAQYNLAIGWTNCNGGGSPDYFHTLGSGIVQLPNCFVGTVSPHSGNACIGGASWYYYPPNFREYLSSHLISPMVIGNTYTVSMYVTNGLTSGTYGGGGIDNLSVAFSTVPLAQPGTDPIPLIPQITFSTLFYSHTWQQLSIQFVANSAYQYVTIGNFALDAGTLYQQFDPCTSPGAYYFFDDITVEESNASPVALFNAPNHTCPGTCIDFTNASTNATSYLWTFTGANPSVSTDVNPTGVCYNTPGNYTVELIATNANTSDTLTLTNYITVYPYPSPQGILQSGDTLFANAGATTYQWYHDGVLIPGATEYYYIAPEGGNYNMVATDENGCEVEAVIFDVIAGISPIRSHDDGKAVNLFPQPVSNELHVSMNNGNQITSMIVFGVLGEKAISSHDQNGVIDCTSLCQGIYLLEIISGEEIYHLKFLKK